jgi:hypothetical protein
MSFDDKKRRGAARRGPSQPEGKRLTITRKGVTTKKDGWFSIYDTKAL